MVSSVSVATLISNKLKNQLASIGFIYMEGRHGLDPLVAAQGRRKLLNCCSLAVGNTGARHFLFRFRRECSTRLGC